MDNFLKIAGPVTLGFAVTLTGLAVTHGSVAVERLAPALKQAGVVGLRIAADTLTAKLGSASGSGSVGLAVG